MKTKTPLLSMLIQHCKETSPELFSDVKPTPAIDSMEKELVQFLEDSPKKKQIDFSNKIAEYTSEYYNLGYIDGFKMCRWITDEMNLTRDEDFLKELLTDFSPNWEFRLANWMEQMKKDEMKEDEVKVLDIYRLMPPEQKKKMLEHFKGWEEGYTHG